MNTAIPYGHQWIDKTDIAEVVKVLKSDWLTQGPKIKEFEDALCGYTGARYAIAVSSGTAALHAACLAAGIKPGDEVITSPVTFVASANCAAYCGARPVFADIQEDTVNIDPNEIRKKVTKKTRALIPVHFAGHPCDLREIGDIAKERDLIVIEDACHALGAMYRGSRIGSCAYSDMSVLSFHPVKHITTGEGGAVLTNNRDLYEKLSVFRNHGITKDKGRMAKCDGPWYYEMQELGFNYRITDVQCALGISQLKKISRFLKRREEIADSYDRGLSEMAEIALPGERPYVRSSWHVYCIRVKSRRDKRRIFEKLLRSGIGVQVHYIPVHLQPYYRKNFGYETGDYPKAERYYEEAITIPLFYGLDDTKIRYIIRKIKDAFKRG